MVTLGPRASLLLGMLVGTPSTVHELCDLIVAAEDDADLLDGIECQGGSIQVALRSLSNGGAQEVRRQLQRMERMGYVSFAKIDSNSPTLWWAIEPRMWP